MMTKPFFGILFATLVALFVASCSLEVPDFSCTPGDTKCEGHIFYKCKLDGSNWDEIVCGSLINPKPFCHTEQICVTCNDDLDCQSDELHCVDHDCHALSVKGCDESDTKCEDSKRYTCIKKAWENPFLCAEGCNIDGTDCLSADEACTNGTTQCTSDGNLATCKNRRWQISDCQAGQVCPKDQTACEDKRCDEGQVYCNAEQNARISCIDNHLVETLCTGEKAFCESGQCVTCLNGEKRCENNAVEICAGNTWTLAVTCKEKTCNDTLFTCVDAICEAGWQRCNGNVIETCNAESVYLPTTLTGCENDFHCLEDVEARTASCVECKINAHCRTAEGGPICHSDKRCVACESTSSKCHDSDGTLLICDADGAWPETGTDCAAGQECLPAALECSDIPNYCTQHDDCSKPLYPVCDEASERCICEIDQRHCKTVDEQAQYAVCDEDGWSDYEDCAPESPVCHDNGLICAQCAKDSDCIDGNICDIDAGLCIADPPCTNDDIVCKGKRALTCIQGQWIGIDCDNHCLDGKACVECIMSEDCLDSDKPACHPDDNRCTECLPNTKTCLDNQLASCSPEGTWEERVACADEEDCLDGNDQCTEISGAPCVEGKDASRCNGELWISCASDLWEITACQEPAPYCHPTLACVECLNDSQCGEALPPYCHKPTGSCVECTENAHCTDPERPFCHPSKNSCELCSDGDMRCANDAANIGQMQICVDNAWTNDSACANDVSCKSASLCGTCQNGDTECIDAVNQRICVNGVFSGSKSCEHGCDLEAGKCKAPPQASSITWCNSHKMDLTNKVAYGRVIDSRDPKDASTITAQLLCGEAGESLEKYQAVSGIHNPACTDCYTNFEYRADLLDLAAGDYLCIWSFNLEGELPVACQRDGSVIQDFDTVPNASMAFEYTAKELIFTYLVDFENFTPNASYINNELLTTGKLTTEIVGAIHNSGSGSIQNNTLVISDETDGHVTVKVDTPNGYIGVLRCHFSSWEDEAFGNDGYDHRLYLYLDNNTSSTTALRLDRSFSGIYTLTIKVFESADSFTFKKAALSGNESPRLLIDNIEWTTEP